MTLRSWWQKQVVEYRENSKRLLETQIKIRRIELSEVNDFGVPSYARFTSEDDFIKYLRNDLAKDIKALRKLKRKETQIYASPMQSSFALLFIKSD
ncbi:MAG: hypothetical protein ABR981_02425 [Candidatus Micrarchaeaceae archaeon]